MQAIVLAAGKSTRFKTQTSKLLEKLCGQEMILYPTILLAQLKIPMTLVVGHQAEEIIAAVKEYGKNSFIHQDQQKGTGDALKQTRELWNAINILVLNGDIPLITQEIINQLIKKHAETDAAITFITSHNADPSNSYGRVIKDGNAFNIIEAKDFMGNAQEQCCINAGIDLFKRSFLEKHIDNLSHENAAQEYYITDLIKIANENNYPIETISAPFDQIRGINTLKELWSAEQIKRSELISHWMQNGVRFALAQSTHIDVTVSIGSGSQIGAGVHLLNNSKIGKNCTIAPFSILDNARIGDNSIIYPHSIITNSQVDKECSVGPFAHLRNNAMLQEKAVIGNFVEVSCSTIGKESKAKHLSYLGDTTIGKEVNIGAGTITCNYNGHTKHRTNIHDRVFIGSNNTLVAPVVVGEESFTAAGSVITENVPNNALAIGRARQVNKKAYAHKIKEGKKKHQESINVSFIAATKTHNDITLEE
jgi:bifunctional UDP-N-acetylglucosamine pyrophosphorylase / glucosamine-1-phosphate N-acetyltransferase